MHYVGPTLIDSYTHAHLILVKEHLKLPHADSEVSLVELVRNVPPQGSKVSALLNQTVEETETKEQPLPRSLHGMMTHQNDN